MKRGKRLLIICILLTLILSIALFAFAGCNEQKSPVDSDKVVYLGENDISIRNSVQWEV